jgi:hypothetical protein
MKSVKIETEIARLYKLGSNGTPPNYESTPETETLMNLYLLDKYKLINPYHSVFIQKYHYHFRTAPIDYHWEHCIYLNNSCDVLNDNCDEYAELFLNNLLEMIRLNPGKKLVCDFKSCLFINDIFELGHSEIVVFDPVFNTFEYVDSNNVPKQYSRKLRKQFVWKESRQQTIEKVVSGLPSNPIYINNTHVYDDYEWGLQSLEAGSGLLTHEEEFGGYCLMWCHFFGDLSLLFPEYSIKSIKEAILKKAYSKSICVKTINDFMLVLIRGYIKDVSNVLSVNLSDNTSKCNACHKIVSKLETL